MGTALYKKTNPNLTGINIISGEEGYPTMEVHSEEGVYIDGKFLNGVMDYTIHTNINKTTIQLNLIVNTLYYQDDCVGMKTERFIDGI